MGPELLSLGGVLADFSVRVTGVLVDPMSGLPGRREFTSLFAHVLGKARTARRTLALLFINPDEFLRVNELFGQETGDIVVGEVSDRLTESVRDGDLLVRYGGVTFAAVLTGTTEKAVTSVAQRLLRQLSSPAYLDGSVQLDFSIGMALSGPGGHDARDPMELVRRADQALNIAKRRGGGTVVVWEESGAEQLESFDRLTGIFTGHVAKDYRNMVLLWDVVNIVAEKDDVGALATATVRKLRQVLKPERTGLFWSGAGDRLELLAGCTREAGENGQERLLESLDVDDACRELVERCCRDDEPCEAAGDSAEADSGPRRHAVPLAKGDRRVGALFLEWGAGAPGLDASDQLFLRSLGLQLAMALERIRLTDSEVARQETEKRELRAELRELRHAVQRAKMVYRSPQMEQVMATARRVAASEATVLITGPSGTGKELLARTVHELSSRRSDPFVIVDCGAIPTTLIESELFGHEKGAYTGAGSRSAGLIAQAEKGTVLLDEIGELPLEVQSKLLRFVEDRVFKSVGGSKAKKVDVRVLAATNRDLAEEVARGRFREDLYYRLNVVHLALPALSARPEDIGLLARHFVELYSVQYQKPLQGLSEGAHRSLLAYPWPGNVRELQNRIMRAVLLCEGPVVRTVDFGLDEEPPSASGGPALAGPAPDASVTDPGPGRAVEGSAPDGPAETARPPVSFEGLLEELAEQLAEQVSATLGMRKKELPPLGRWLSDELLVAADDASRGVVTHGAEALGLPISTYRRRLLRVLDERSAGTPSRPPGWSRTVAVVERLVAGGRPAEGNLVELAEVVLLRQIVRRYPDDTAAGSALLGVTPPTFRRRVAPLLTEVAASF